MPLRSSVLFGGFTIRSREEESFRGVQPLPRLWGKLPALSKAAAPFPRNVTEPGMGKALAGSGDEPFIRNCAGRAGGISLYQPAHGEGGDGGGEKGGFGAALSGGPK